MLEAAGRLALRRPKRVLAGALVFALVALAVSSDVVPRLGVSGYADPGSPSARADRVLQREFGVVTPNLLLEVSSRRPMTDPQVAALGTRLALRLARARGVERVRSYWTSGRAGRALLSRDGRSALIVAGIKGSDDTVSKRAKSLVPRYRGAYGPVTVRAGGLGPLIGDTEKQVTDDLKIAEAISLPLTLLALVIVFRGIVAAMLPLAVGMLSIVGTLLVLRVLSELVDVSVFALNLTTALGLGLAIDYSLFIVARYRAELRRGRDRDEAILVTLRTAGRTIAFSAAIVAVSLSALVAFPMYYLRSFAYVGVAVVAMALVGAVLVVPALLALLGPRIDALSLERWRAGSGAESRFWQRFAHAVMRRPAPVAAASIAVLIALALPFLHASMSFSDDRNLPATVPSRQVSDDVRHDFPARADATTFALVDDGGRPATVGRYARALSRVRGVLAVNAATGTFARGRLAGPPLEPARTYTRGGRSWLAVETGVEPFSPAGERLVRALRAVPAPFPATVTSTAAQLVDAKHAISRVLPVALAIVALATFAVLMLMTGSLLVPVKALAVNTLSLTAVFGVMVYVFQDGHLQWLVGHTTATGTINVLNPPLVFCIAFGLSMDYEVFMLSRIKEERDRGATNTDAVARGLQRAAPVITAAAAVMAIVFLAFATSGVTNVKMIGVALAFAVILDATLVRAALVPAFMRLAGRLNWWLPPPLRRARATLGVADGELLAEPAAAPPGG
jgi:putative drug exporter of the RND superfamily